MATNGHARISRRFSSHILNIIAFTLSFSAVKRLKMASIGSRFMRPAISATLLPSQHLLAEPETPDTTILRQDARPG